jgi:Ca-activated chloride channel family protein
MNRHLELEETEDAAGKRQRRQEDPYASTRARLSGRSDAVSTTKRVIDESPQATTSSLISIITVTASLATIFGAIQGLSLPWSNSAIVSVPVPVSTVAPPPSGLPDFHTSNPLPAQEPSDSDSGALDALGQDGKRLGACPLKHTSVDAKVSGYTARVTVKQIFQNPYKNKIEARYRFPLSHQGAVDEMTMKIGGRVIKGAIKRREDAARIYEQAKSVGQVASLLDQERTNIFTQSIANLESGKEVEVTIKYTEILNYKDGAFQFVFPTVVGPRFQPYGSSEAVASSRTDSFGLARIVSLDALSSQSTTTNTQNSGTRAGHDISLNVSVDAGLPIRKLSSPLHGILSRMEGPSTATVSLKQLATIPNRDFVLDIEVAKDGLKSGYVATKSGRDGYATVMVMPPSKVRAKDIAPRELIFLVDCSGSQSGKPIQKSRETLKYVIDHVNDNDTFQIITFNDSVQSLFAKPEKMSISRKVQAQMFVDKISANGGTWMAPAVEAACNLPADENRLRIVSFMTDGYVGNDYEVIGLVKKLRGTSRWFPFGVGDSVNRTLIDEIARAGGGESDFVLLNSSGEEVGRKFYERISTPVLTDVHLSTDGVELHDVYPRAVSDVWSERPLYFTAKYSKSGTGKIYVNGFAHGKPYREVLSVNLPARDSTNSQVGQIWARTKIDELMSQDWQGAQTGAMSEHVKEEIVQTALSHHLLSQFTSFVAVDESRSTSGASAGTVDVPLEMPEGVNEFAKTGQTNYGNQIASTQYGAAQNYAIQSNGFQSNSVPISAAQSSPSYTAQTPAFQSENPLLEKAMRSVVGRLNDLSCAASSSCAYGSYPASGSVSSNAGGSFFMGSSAGGACGAASTAPGVLNRAGNQLNLGDLALLPWSLVPAPVRSGIILFLVFVAAVNAQNMAKAAAASREISLKSKFFVTALFLFAMILAVAHWTIVRYPLT